MLKMLENSFSKFACYMYQLSGCHRNLPGGGGAAAGGGGGTLDDDDGSGDFAVVSAADESAFSNAF